MADIESRRRELNSRFRHDPVGAGTDRRREQTDAYIQHSPLSLMRQDSKGLILRMGSIQCSLLVFMILWILLLELNIGRRVITPELDTTCGGLPLWFLFLVKCASTTSVTLLVGYQRSYWVAAGWSPSKSHVRSNAALGCVDFVMSVWLFFAMIGSCWSTAAMYIFAFITLIGMIITAVVNLYILVNLNARIQAEKERDNEPQRIRPRIGMAQTMPTDTGGGGNTFAGYKMDPAIPRENGEKQFSLSITNPLHESETNQKDKLWNNTTKNANTLEGASGMNPEKFADYWGSLPESGSFNCTVQHEPSLDQLRKHLAERNFSVMASGVVQDQIKLYFSGEEIGQDHRTMVLFFAELILVTSTMQLSVTFKCDVPDATKKFVKNLQLRKLFFSDNASPSF